MENKKYLWKKILIWLAFLGLISFALLRLYYYATDDFRMANIVHPLPFQPQWEIESLSSTQQKQLDDILAQKFSYLGKGAQSYAFESADGKYVLKFFKFKHLKPSWFVNLLPDIYPFKEYRERSTARKQRKFYGIFNSYRLAYEQDRDEAGLIFIQLNPLNHPKKEVTLIDKLGLERTVDLGSVVYVVQKKGKTLRTLFSELLDQGQIELVKKRIGQIFDLYLGEYKKGLNDHDHGVMQNSGFIDDKPIHLDVGKLNKNDQMRELATYQEDLLLVATKMAIWLKKNYSKDYPQLSRYMDERLSEILGQKITLEKPAIKTEIISEKN